MLAIRSPNQSHEDRADKQQRWESQYVANLLPHTDGRRVELTECACLRVASTRTGTRTTGIFY